MREIKTLTIRLPDEIHKKFKMYALTHDSDMQAILIECIKELIESQEEDLKK